MSSPKLSGNSVNKFDVLQSVTEDVTADCSSPKHVHSPEPVAKQSEGKKRSHGTFPDRNLSCTDPSSSEDDILDTTTPLKLVINSSTKVKSRIHNPIQTSPSAQALRLEQDEVQMVTSDLKENSTSRLIKLKSIPSDQSSNEEEPDSEKEIVQVKHSSRGAARGRNRGRGGKHPR